MTLLAAITRWFATNVPSDEALPVENEAEIRLRMAKNIEVCREVAQRRLAELHTTTSPIHRRAS